MKKYIIALMLCSGLSLSAQEATPNGFVPPLHIPLALSGNFGELRANHFHSGLDFKTQGKTGLPIYSIADGYVSKIYVSLGSGYMLHVKHTNGYTSVYRHMLGFVGSLAAYTEKFQYEHELDEVEIPLGPNEFKVKAGQQIGWSGNEGFSFGPHLHLEVFDTESGDFVDPLPFFQGGIKDDRAPVSEAFILFPQRGRGVINGVQTNQRFLANSQKVFDAWGEIAVGIKARDYMNGVQNRFGVYRLSMFVDGQLIYSSTMDHFSSYENRMINSWNYGGYMKAFRDPGNTLRFIQTNEKNGIVNINEEREYKFVFVLKDAYGNTSTSRFSVNGRKQEIPVWSYGDKYLVKWNEMNLFAEPGVQLVIPSGMVYQDEPINFKSSYQSGAVASDCQLHSIELPLHAPCELQIGIRRMVTPDTTKYYIAQKRGRSSLYIGGKYNNGFVCGQIKELGTYTVKADTIPPRIRAVAKNLWSRTGMIPFVIYDSETGIKSYKGKIDGKFALFHLKLRGSRLTYRLDPRRVVKGGKHTIELLVTDKCGNSSIYRDSFIW